MDRWMDEQVDIYTHTYTATAAYSCTGAYTHTHIYAHTPTYPSTGAYTGTGRANILTHLYTYGQAERSTKALLTHRRTTTAHQFTSK